MIVYVPISTDLELYIYIDRSGTENPGVLDVCESFQVMDITAIPSHQRGWVSTDICPVGLSQ